ncbi:MAG: ABC transporter permease [Bacteroidetes bacterium]|nr:ABC transporter permease [Bacteroidota bacterium]
MNKFKYIISREYSVRVRKRTFWILTFLLPVLYAGLIGFSVYMSVNPGYEKQQVTVIDYSGLYDHYFQDSEDMKFSYAEKGTEQQILELMKQQKDFHLLVIPEFEIDDPSEFKLSSCKNSANFVEGRLESELSSLIKDQRINALGLEKEVINQLAPDIQINHEMIGPAGSERDNTDQSMVVSSVAGFLIYMFVFIYGSLVMRGIHEEKQNRIVEIIVSSVKPFELMMGKIIGVALVGLTQFFLWVLFILAITFVGMKLPDMGVQNAQQGMDSFLSGMSALNIPFILSMFLVYFIGGYLLYSSLLGAIAAAVDNQSDMQQFMLPITIPLIIAIVAMQAVIRAPHSPVAIWLSMIPFTSPIIMIARVPFDVPLYQLVVSMALLIVTFVFTVWIAGRIYRVGILLHGTKISYKDLWKWMFYN